MKHKTSIQLIISILILICTNTIYANKNISIIPQPLHVEYKAGDFMLEDGYSIKIKNKTLKSSKSYLSEKIEGMFAIQESEDKSKQIIHILLSKKEDVNDESYSLEISKHKITIKAKSQTGIFYATQSLLQYIYSNQNKLSSTIHIPCVSIKDNPRFAWRGFMLDESRHFFGMQKVKQILDIMAYHKLNRFHWHLSDSDAWRLEIKQYPKLTSIGAIGSYSDKNAKAQFYTQAQIKEIIAYASMLHITIIPEIDMPGHARAAVRAYPEFSGGGSEKYPNFTFNPASEKTYEFLGNILSEVAALFPSPWIHIGVDEVHFGNQHWNNMPEVKELIKRENLSTLKDVEKYFALKMSKKIRKLGKIITGWDEIVEHNIPVDNTLVMWWRHDHPEVLKEALSKSYKTVLCPRLPFYFDFVQYKDHKNGRLWAGKFCNLESVYSAPQLPEGITIKESANIQGVQANLWTERIISEQQLDYMMYPRMSALSEAGWTAVSNKNYISFQENLKPMLKFLKKENISYFDIFNPKISPEILITK